MVSTVQHYARYNRKLLHACVIDCSTETLSLLNLQLRKEKSASKPQTESTSNEDHLTALKDIQTSKSINEMQAGLEDEQTSRLVTPASDWFLHDAADRYDDLLSAEDFASRHILQAFIKQMKA
jgi:hypothetical protein